MFEKNIDKYYDEYEKATDGRRYLKTLVQQLSDELEETGTIANMADKKATMKHIDEVFDEKDIAQEESEEELTREEYEKERDKIDVGVETGKFLNELLKDLFGGVVRIHGQPVNANTFYKEINAESVTMRGEGKGKSAVEIGEKIGPNGATSNLLQDDLWELAQKPDIKERIEKLAEYADMARNTRLSFKNVESIQVRDTIKNLMGWGRFWQKDKRESVYSGWEEVAEKHDAVWKSIDKLILKLPDNGTTNTLKLKNDKFNKDGEYVREFENQIPDQHTSDTIQATMKVVEAYLFGSDGLGLSESIGHSETQDGSATVDPTAEDEDKEGDWDSEADSIDDAGLPKEGYSQVIDNSMDILGYYYIINYMDGIFIGEESIPNIKSLAIDAIKNHIGFSSPDQIASLNRHLFRLEKVEKTQGSAFLPIYILNNPMVKKKFTEYTKEVGSHISVKNVNDTIEDLFDALLDSLVDVRMVMSNTVDGPMGQTFDLHDKSKQKTQVYGGFYPNTESRSKDLPEIKTEVKAVLDAIVDYFYRPLMNPLMSLNLTYDFKDSIKFKELLLLTDTDFARAYKKMHSKVIKSRGRLLDAEQLEDLYNFFKSVNKPSIDLREVVDDITALHPTIQKLFDNDNKIVTLFKKEMAAYVGHLYKAMDEEKQKDNANLVVLGYDALKMQEEMPIDDIKEMNIIMVIQDFLLDPTAKAITTRHPKIYKRLVGIINEIKKSELEDRILQVHDSLRILKKLPVYYGRGSLASMDDLGEVIDLAKKTFNVDIIGTEIVKMVEEIDAFSNIAKSVGVSEEVVYFVKANFR